MFGRASSQGVLRRLFTLSVLAASLTLTGCEQDSPSGQVVYSSGVANMSVSPPMQLQGRDFVRENLTLTININGQDNVVEANADGNFIFNTTLPQQSSTVVSLKWTEVIDGVDLILATASKPLNTGTQTTLVALDFFSSEYDTSMDADGDGISNLEERQRNFRFNDATSPNAPLISVPLEVRLFLPLALAGSSENIKNRVSARAALNGSDLELTRNGREWRGSTTVTKDSSPLVLAEFFASSELRVLIARLSRSDNAGGGFSVIFNEGEYETAQFNEDNDALTNMQETVIGSDPFNSNSPPDDGDGDGIPDVRDNCASISNADQADIDSDGLGDPCDTTNALDLDGDGRNNDVDNCPARSNADQADIDSDGFGDVCDSQNDDPDGDGRNNGVDNCPNDSNADQQDSDGNGIGDVCDTPIVIDIPDTDGDGFNDNEDNCPDNFNDPQLDSDGDGVGDACQVPEEAVDGPDTDGDGIDDDDDNCPDVFNPLQEDEDEDDIGDACPVI